MFLFVQRFSFILLIALPFHHAVSAEPLPDFAAFDDTRAKKQAFFEYMLPKINKANAEILKERAFVQKNTPRIPLTTQWVKLIEKYRIDTTGKTTQDIKQSLLKRVDIIPPSLALVQAANESSWGTSRFAKKANNLYGQWCFSEGCGLVPNQRQSGMTHEVKTFKTPSASIKSYMKNLNTHPAFKALRDIRYGLRKQNKVIEGQKLSAGLMDYSERKKDYVRELNRMISFNRLEPLDFDSVF